MAKVKSSGKTAIKVILGIMLIAGITVSLFFLKQKYDIKIPLIDQPTSQEELSKETGEVTLLDKGFLKYNNSIYMPVTMFTEKKPNYFIWIMAVLIPSGIIAAIFFLTKKGQPLSIWDDNKIIDYMINKYCPKRGYPKFESVHKLFHFFYDGTEKFPALILTLCTQKKGVIDLDKPPLHTIYSFLVDRTNPEKRLPDDFGHKYIEDCMKQLNNIYYAREGLPAYPSRQQPGLIPTPEAQEAVREGIYEGYAGVGRKIVTGGSA